MLQPDGSIPRISIVIPALNEADMIATTVAAVAALDGSPEVIVVDGGSRDGTAVLAAAHGARVITSSQGRGAQMHAGALTATGDVLWFLHADTVPPPQASPEIIAALADPTVVGGNFQIRFAGDFLAARLLTRLYRHLALLGLRYGDSGYFVRRETYLAAGGFRPYPIFEDLDLLVRLRRRGRFVRVAATVTTSSRRFEGRSFAIVFAWWTALQVLYWMGIPPGWLGRLYHHVRSPGRRRRVSSRRKEIANASFD